MPGSNSKKGNLRGTVEFLEVFNQKITSHFYALEQSSAGICSRTPMSLTMYEEMDVVVCFNILYFFFAFTPDSLLIEPLLLICAHSHL